MQFKFKLALIAATAFCRLTWIALNQLIANFLIKDLIHHRSVILHAIIYTLMGE